MSAAELKELLKQAEVAEMLNLDESTLEGWRYGKNPTKLPYIKMGTSPRSPVRYKRVDVEAFIEQNRRSNDTIVLPARRVRRRPRR
jgi:Helix-turn-helix domain